MEIHNVSKERNPRRANVLPSTLGSPTMGLRGVPLSTFLCPRRRIHVRNRCGGADQAGSVCLNIYIHTHKSHGQNDKIIPLKANSPEESRKDARGHNGRESRAREREVGETIMSLAATRASLSAIAIDTAPRRGQV